MKQTFKQVFNQGNLENTLIELTKKYQCNWHTDSEHYYYNMSTMNPLVDSTPSKCGFDLNSGWDGFETDDLQEMIDFIAETGIGYDPEM